MVDNVLEGTKEEAQALIDILALRGNPLHSQFQHRRDELELTGAPLAEWVRMVEILRDLTLF